MPARGCAGRVSGGVAGTCSNCYACFAHVKPEQREWNLRPFAAGLLQSETISISETVFVLFLLATVTFDGFMVTPLWVEIEAALQNVVSGLGHAGLQVIRSFGLFVFSLLLLEIYIIVSVSMALASKKRLAAVTLAQSIMEGGPRTISLGEARTTQVYHALSLISTPRQ
jgi:hypothetical protein